ARACWGAWGKRRKTRTVLGTGYELLPPLLRFQIGPIRLHGRGFAGELEFGAGGEVLDVVVDVPGTGERLPVIDPLGACGGESQESQTQTAEGVSQASQ